MFRKLRILLLLLVLATVSLSNLRTNQKLKAWEHSIHVAVYPIAGDTAPETARFVRELGPDDLQDIALWMQAQTQRYGLSVLRPVSIRLAPPVTERPPPAPQAPGALDAILWSLKMRWWARQHDEISGPQPDIRLFVLFHSPQQQGALAHSVGMNKGQIGLIHAFASADQQAQNMVVITHELLHIFGASDKYNPSTLQPIYPQGYAEPERNPPLPQAQTEIMAGRRPITPEQAEIPASLDDTLVGPGTALEIGWTKNWRRSSTG